MKFPKYYIEDVIPMAEFNISFVGLVTARRSDKKVNF